MAKRSAQRNRRRFFCNPEFLEPRTMMAGDLSSWQASAYVAGPALFDTIAGLPGATAEIAPAAAAVVAGASDGHHDHDHDPIRANDPDADFIYLQHDTIPNFVRTPTNVALRSGRWSDVSIWSAGRLPGSGDVVQIVAGASVEYSIVSDAPLSAVGINPGATLRFARDVNTRLTVGTLIVFEGGALEIGRPLASIMSRAKAEVVFANQALDLAGDPKQYGIGLLGFGKITVSGAQKPRTFLKLAREPLAGQTYLDLAEPAHGWQPGETVFLPDARQVPGHMAQVFDTVTMDIFEPKWEELQIQRVSGNRVYLTSPIQYDHLGARNAEGVLETLPHAALLDRNVVFRSQVPDGTRGHILLGGRAEVNLRYARLQSLGRTTALDPLDNTTLDSSGAVTHIGTNQIGRYSLHLHHLVGPHNHTNTGYQFQVTGNTIDDGRKWGMALHGTSFGLIKDNVVYKHEGAGFATEDGTEIENLFYRNFAARIIGTNDESTDMSDTGRAGDGFWLRRAANTFQYNVVANASAAGMVIHGHSLPNAIYVAAFRGAIPSEEGQSIEVATNPQNIISDLEVYGRTRFGVWMSFPTGRPHLESNLVLRRLTVWNSHGAGIFAYHFSGLTIDRALLLGNRENLGMVKWSQVRHTSGMQFTNYEAINLVIANSRIENFHYGILAPDSSGGTRRVGVAANPTLIENTILANIVNLRVQTAKYDMTELPGKELRVNNTHFRRVNTAGFRYLPPYERDIEMRYIAPEASRDYMSRDLVLVQAFNGVAGDNFRVYYEEQAATFTPPVVMYGIGSPLPNMTNWALWTIFGTAIGGAIAPTSTRPGILGFVGPYTASSAPAAPLLAK